MTFGFQWNWELNDWPQFRYDAARLAPLEVDFLQRSGVFIGAVLHVEQEDKQEITADLMSDEALHTSEIEGEMLNRESLQSSIRRHLGLATDHRRVPAAEQGVSDLMVDLHRNFAELLSEAGLFRWQEMLMSGRRDLQNLGGYRTSEEPMQIVSGALHDPKIHFEAPPATQVPAEMKAFVRWFNDSAPAGARPLPALARAALAHWYFVSIHPFEDGNGRIARALAEKALSQAVGEPVLLALSRTINSRRKTYYHVLESGNRSNEISAWMSYFAGTVLEAQATAQRLVDFLIDKAKFFDRLRGQLNPRQEKVLLRMFREGPDGFKGGLSADKYIKIAYTSRATATRDLQDLVEKGALTRAGELKGTRYSLSLGR